MPDLDPATVMAEHYPDPIKWANGPWCHACVTSAYPCETYRLAEEVAALRAKVARVWAELPPPDRAALLDALADHPEQKTSHV